MAREAGLTSDQGLIEAAPSGVRVRSMYRLGQEHSLGSQKSGLTPVRCVIDPD